MLIDIIQKKYPLERKWNTTETEIDFKRIKNQYYCYINLNTCILFQEKFLNTTKAKNELKKFYINCGFHDGFSYNIC